MQNQQHPTTQPQSQPVPPHPAGNNPPAPQQNTAPQQSWAEWAGQKYRNGIKNAVETAKDGVTYAVQTALDPEKLKRTCAATATGLTIAATHEMVKKEKDGSGSENLATEYLFGAGLLTIGAVTLHKMSQPANSAERVTASRQNHNNGHVINV